MKPYNTATENRIERCPDCDIPVNVWVNRNQCYRCGHTFGGDVA